VARKSNQKSISSKGGSGASTRTLIMVGGIFLVLGSAFFIVLGALPFLEQGGHSDLIGGGMGLLFAIIGGGIILHTVRNKGRAQKLPPSPLKAPQAATGTVELPPGQKPLMTFIFACVFALFWNGIVGLFLGIMLSDLENITIFPLLFMIPFVLVGLGLIGFALYSFLAMFNPQPHLKLTPGAIPLGATAELEWTVIGTVQRITKFTLELQGQEVARYQQGTDTVTVTSVFEKIPLFEGSGPNEIRMGRVQIAFPEFTMHTFEAPNNKIQWLIKVKGEVPRWPDINLEFPVTVLPLPPASTA